MAVEALTILGFQSHLAGTPGSQPQPPRSADSDSKTVSTCSCLAEGSVPPMEPAPPRGGGVSITYPQTEPVTVPEGGLSHLVLPQLGQKRWVPDTGQRPTQSNQEPAVG